MSGEVIGIVIGGVVAFVGVVCLVCWAWARSQITPPVCEKQQELAKASKSGTGGSPVSEALACPVNKPIPTKHSKSKHASDALKAAVKAPGSLKLVQQVAASSGHSHHHSHHARHLHHRSESVGLMPTIVESPRNPGDCSSPKSAVSCSTDSEDSRLSSAELGSPPCFDYGQSGAPAATVQICVETPAAAGDVTVPCSEANQSEPSSAASTALNQSQDHDQDQEPHRTSAAVEVATDAELLNIEEDITVSISH